MQPETELTTAVVPQKILGIERPHERWDISTD